MKKLFSKRFPASMLRAVLVSSVSVLAVAAFTGVTLQAHTVVIHDQNQVYSILTTSNNPAEILGDEGITLGENDYYDFTEVVDGEADLYVVRPHEVEFTDGGETRTVYTTSATVSDLMEELGVEVGEDDVLNVSTERELSDGMEIKLSHYTYKERTETSKIKFDTIREGAEPSDSTVETVVTEGVNGKKETVYRDVYLDGKLERTEVVSDKVTKQPVDEVIEVTEATTELYVGGYLRYYAPGEAPVELDENGLPVNYAYKVSGKATAYSALGKPTELVPGCVAMDLSQYPRGTKLYITASDGSYVYGYAWVADTGIAVCDGRVLVDCYYTTYEESCAFGAKTVDVYVLE